jgi:DNA-binding CsgD family transcriptional regulator
MYGSRIPTSFTRPQLIIISGYRKEWWDYYNEQEYLKVDPVVDYCANHTLPLQWHNLNAQILEKKIVRQLMNEATEFGLNSGLSLPVHTPDGEFAMLTFTSEEKPREFGALMQEITPLMMYFAYHMHESVMNIFRETNTYKLVELTDREKECLLWAAEGKTSHETADIIRISESTVRFHLNNAARKLDVYSKSHAVAKAICSGLISPIL